MEIRSGSAIAPATLVSERGSSSPGIGALHSQILVMLPLGKYTRLGECEIWLTTPVFSLSNEDSRAQKLPYYDVLVHRIPANGKFAGYPFYVNVPKLLELNLAERNPLYAKVFPTKPRSEEERVPLTPEEEEFRDEFQVYQTRKDMSMPLCRLSRRHLLALLDKLQ